jgi:hypothetical protein
MTPLALHLQSIFMKNERFSAFSIGALMLLAIVVMGIISLTVLNDKATKGYLLNKLEGERQELVTDGEITDRLIMRARSMHEVEERSLGMMLVDRTDVTYVLPIGAVALTP